MQTVDLNLASRPFKNDTLPWVGFVVAVLSLGFASWYNVDAWHRHRTMLVELQERQEGIDLRLEELERRSTEAVRRIDKMNLPVLLTRSDKANEVIRWKAFSWTRLFNMLQEVQPHDVQLTSIHPVFRGEKGPTRDEIEDLEQVPVSVEGTAKDLRAFLAFERALIASPHFDRIDPGTLATDDITSETIFRMRFLYDPRIREEEAAAEETIAEAGGEGAPAEDAEGGGVAPAADGSPVEEGAPVDALAEMETEQGVAPLATDDLPKIKRGGRKRKNKPAAEPDAVAGAALEAPPAGAGSASPAEADPPPNGAAEAPADSLEPLPVREPRPGWGEGPAPLRVDDADEGEDGAR